MSAKDLIPCDHEAIKSELLAMFSGGIDGLVEQVESGAGAQALERKVWEVIVSLGAQLLANVFGQLALRTTNDDLRARELKSEEVVLRNDKDYWQTVNTSFGKVTFPLYSYRDYSRRPIVVTRTPARAGPFSHHHRCKSSLLLVEWESRLGSEFPFRRAEDALAFFSHGAVRVEDTTIARHAVMVGNLIDRQWLYRPLSEVREILAQRATRDTESGKPIMYASTDAHALRRYVDETWDAQWKMANGIRLWCVDRFTGATIHIGGEYTWGDCTQVGAAFAALIKSGHLPRNGDYGDDLMSVLVFVTDGAEWFNSHVLHQFTWAISIIDAYHLMERLATYSNERFGRSTVKARQFYEQCLATLFGPRHRPLSTPKARHGKKSTRPKEPGTRPCRRGAAGGKALLKLINNDVGNKANSERHRVLVGFIKARLPKMDYPRFKHLGFQIGSGAMESLHRTGSQCRLKIPGGRWLEETSQAIFNLRMMLLAGRWQAFWEQDGLRQMIAQVPSRPPHVQAA